MKVFVTGASGYIGQRLVARLLEVGNEVHALCRQKPEFPSFQHEGFHYYLGDLLDKPTVTKAMEGCENVYHLAGLAKVWSKEPNAFYDINVSGTRHVLDAALINEVRKVVFTSSGATYGISNGVPLTEENVRTNSFFTEYESSKFFAEECVLHYATKGLDVVIVHPTKVYGPGLWTESNAMSQMIKSYIEGEWHIIPGNGKTIGNFCFIEDVVIGHFLAMEKGRAGEKYILGGTNASFNEFFSLLKKVSNKNCLTIHIPFQLMMMYGWQEEWIAGTLGRSPKITRPWVRKISHDQALSSEKAVSELGYKITPLEEGLMKTLEWLQA